MRLEAVTLGGLLATGVVCSAARGFDVAQPKLLQRRHAELHDNARREPSRTVNRIVKRNDVFGDGGVWPTVPVPAGFTLAAGVEITPLPSMAAALSTPTVSAAIISSILASSTPLSNPNPAQWDMEAEQSCMDAVSKLGGKATNPAGLAVCYNLPYLDQQKGTFEAELRMYTISGPNNPFVGVTPAMMSVTLQYQGATIQKSDGTLPVKKRQVQQMPPMVPGTLATNSKETMQAQEVAIRRYVGQVNKVLMQPGMNLTQLQPLLIPQITISAVNPMSNQLVSTFLSSTEASFVVGVFSRAAGSISDPSFLLGKPAEQIAAAAQGLPTPFVIPGLSLGVFPVGLIVTSSWLLLFSLAVGIGTIGRIQFREEYRRTIKAQQDGGGRRL